MDRKNWIRKKNRLKNIKFIPEQKIIVNHERNIKTDWPRSGWLNKRNKIINNKTNV